MLERMVMRLIDSLSNYAIAIICSSFLMNIIQMILPNSANRKYVIFVCGVIVTIILVNPVVSFVNKDFDLQELFEKNQKEYIDLEKDYESKYNDEVILKYKKNIEDGIVERLNEAGYVVHNIECEYDEYSLEPKALRLDIEADDGGVTPVRIEVSSNYKACENKVSFVEITNIKSMIKKTYGINDIKINEQER